MIFANDFLIRKLRQLVLETDTELLIYRNVDDNSPIPIYEHEIYIKKDISPSELQSIVKSILE